MASSSGSQFGVVSFDWANHENSYRSRAFDLPGAPVYPDDADLVTQARMVKAKNNRTKDICDAAKASGAIVYTIGFEAPYSGRQVLMNCASSDAHFFDVNGTEIADAFSSIATSIRKLRLTQ